MRTVIRSKDTATNPEDHDGVDGLVVGGVADHHHARASHGGGFTFFKE